MANASQKGPSWSQIKGNAAMVSLESSCQSPALCSRALQASMWSLSDASLLLEWAVAKPAPCSVRPISRQTQSSVQKCDKTMESIDSHRATNWSIDIRLIPLRIVKWRLYKHSRRDNRDFTLANRIHLNTFHDLEDSNISMSNVRCNVRNYFRWKLVHSFSPIWRTLSRSTKAIKWLQIQLQVSVSLSQSILIFNLTASPDRVENN